MSETDMETPKMEAAIKYDADAKYANDADFLAWITDLETVIRDWDAKHNNSPYELPLAHSTGLDCWRTYYDDETSPDDAFAEDQTYWGD